MRRIKRFFGFVFLIIIILVTVFAMIGYKKYQSALEQKPLHLVIEEIKSIENYTYIDEVPDIYINAVIAAEDRRFKYHNGFDLIGTLRAIVVDITKREFVEGGSTITQQLAKNLYFQNDNSPLRKMAEIFMAFQMEQELSKEEILELYFNAIYYGSGYYNIYDASMGYFGKPPLKMNDYEATLLAGVPNAPSVYSPKVNPHLAKKRQEKILECLVDKKYITKEEALKILNSSL